MAENTAIVRAYDGRSRGGSPRHDAGRYQAIPLEGESARGASRVLIIDSQDGHVWTWSGNELIADSASGRRYGTAFIYQGKVRPGNKAGDMIDLQLRKESPVLP